MLGPETSASASFSSCPGISCKYFHCQRPSRTRGTLEPRWLKSLEVRPGQLRKKKSGPLLRALLAIIEATLVQFKQHPWLCYRAVGCHGNGGGNAARLQGRQDLEVCNAEHAPFALLICLNIGLIILPWETRNVFLCRLFHQESRVTSTQAFRFQSQLPLLYVPIPNPE